MNACGAFTVQDTNSNKKRNTDFEAIREIWGLAAAANPKMRAIDLRVIMVLQSYLSRRDFTAFPGIATIARQIEKAPRTVQRSLQHIAELGHLEIERRWDQARRCWQSNRYHPQIPQINETLQQRYAVTLQKLTPPPGVEMTPPSRRENDVITSDLTSEGTSSPTGVAERDAIFEGSKRAFQEGGASRRERKEGPAARPSVPIDMLEDAELVKDMLCGEERSFIAVLGMAKTRPAWEHIDGTRLANLINAGLLRHDQHNGPRGTVWAPEEDAA